MSGGISLLVFSLRQLFDVDVSWKCYLYILVICSVLLPMLLFLGMLPKDEAKAQPGAATIGVPERNDTFSLSPAHGRISACALCLCQPASLSVGNCLQAGYPGSLWRSWRDASPLNSGCIPSRVQEKQSAINEWIARWLPALVLPLLVLMTVGIIRRFNDYGVTINRLYLITLNIWCYIVCYRTRLH